MTRFCRTFALVFGLALSASAHAQIRTCEDAPNSPASTTPTQITITNDHTDTGYVYWVDFEGNPKLMGVLERKQQLTIDTYVGHVFYLSNFDLYCWGIFIA